MSNAKKMREAIAKRQAEQASREEKEQPKKDAVEVVDLEEFASALSESVQSGGVVQPKKVSLAEAQKQFGLKPEKPATESQRLPDNSQFLSYYKAEEKRWYGSLIIWIGEEAKIFNEDSGAVMKLLRKLDVQYREWLQAQEAKDEVVPAERR